MSARIRSVMFYFSNYFTQFICVLHCIFSGAGGVESMIFAEEIFEMYRRYSEFRGWNWLAIQHETVPSGGLRSALVMLEGESCYADMRFEAGIHRVQRIPFNASVMHTSTMSVAVLPEPENVCF